MNETMETYYSKDRKLRVRVVYDEGGCDAEPIVNLGSGFEAVIPSGARFTLGGEATFQREFDEFNDRGRAGLFPRWLRIFHGIEAVMLYRYEHSAVAYSVASFMGRAQHAEWDSGPCGFMYYAEKDPDMRKWWDDKGPEKQQAGFEQIAEALTDWANGWYYGVIEEELSEGGDPEDDDDWEERDSTYGILGSEHAEAEALCWVEIYEKAHSTAE